MTPEERARITVVIPTKNEEENLPWVLERVKPYYGELIVVDGHSTDRTREIAEAAGARVVLDEKTGKGGALRVGRSGREGRHRGVHRRRWLARP